MSERDFIFFIYFHFALAIISSRFSLRGRRSKGKGRELGRETTRERGGRREEGNAFKETIVSPSRLLIKKNHKNNATVND